MSIYTKCPYSSPSAAVRALKFSLPRSTPLRVPSRKLRSAPSQGLFSDPPHPHPPGSETFVTKSTSSLACLCFLWLMPPSFSRLSVTKKNLKLYFVWGDYRSTNFCDTIERKCVLNIKRTYNLKMAYVFLLAPELTSLC